MSNFNYFGAAFQDIIDLYPNVSVADFGGQTLIEDEMGRAVRRITNAMPAKVHELLTDKVTLEKLTGPAYAGQGPIFTLGLGPVLDDGSLKLYRVTTSDGSAPSTCPTYHQDNQTGTLSGTGNQTLTLTGTDTLSNGEYLYATYTIDPQDSAFSLPSLADYVVYSAGAVLGHKLFDQETDTWELVVTYERRAGDTDDLNNKGIFHELKKGEFVTDAIRSLEFCESIEPAGATVGSIRKSRA